MGSERTTWTETRYEFVIKSETTAYEDGHWISRESVDVTVEKCGSPGTAPEEAGQ